MTTTLFLLAAAITLIAFFVPPRLERLRLPLLVVGWVLIVIAELAKLAGCDGADEQSRRAMNTISLDLCGGAER